MLSTGGSTRLDPEGEEEGEEEEEEGEEVTEGYERTQENDGQDTSNTNTPANSSGGGNNEGGTAERVYQGLLPQHFNVPQKVTPLFLFLSKYCPLFKRSPGKVTSDAVHHYHCHF